MNTLDNFKGLEIAQNVSKYLKYQSNCKKFQICTENFLTTVCIKNVYFVQIPYHVKVYIKINK